MLVEARAKAGVRVEKVLHLSSVARGDDDKVIAVVFHHLQKRLDGLLPEVVRAARRQSVSLVYEEDAAERLLRHVSNLHRRLADEARDKPRAVCLYKMSAPQHAERSVDLRDETRHGRLAGAGV